MSVNRAQFVKLDDTIVRKEQYRQIVTLILYVSSIFQIIAHNMVYQVLFQK